MDFGLFLWIFSRILFFSGIFPRFLGRAFKRASNILSCSSKKMTCCQNGQKSQPQLQLSRRSHAGPKILASPKTNVLKEAGPLSTKTYFFCQKKSIPFLFDRKPQKIISIFPFEIFHKKIFGGRAEARFLGAEKEQKN